MAAEIEASNPKHQTANFRHPFAEASAKTEDYCPAS
jgi:hypothetical protein